MNIVAQRLLSQHLAGESWAHPAEVVQGLGAVQAQDYTQALWAIGVRLASATVGTVTQAITDRQILRTWPMRGTIHFVPAVDAKWLVNLSAPRMLARDGRRQALLELNETILGQCKDLCVAALADGQPMPRPALLQLFEDAGIRTQPSRGYHILWYLAQTGVLCFGPMQGKQPTFVLLDAWVPHARVLDRDEALATLAGRYIAGHGPATAHDFAWWAGLTLTDARRGLAAATPQLRQQQSDTSTYWLAADAPAQAQLDHTAVQLLPGFDEYLLGYQDRSAMLAAEHAPHIVPGSNGIFQPMIVVAGQIVGTWKRAARQNSLGATLNPLRDVAPYAPQLAQAAAQYRAFWETTPR
ncbi:MAG: winged helix DNA-binding domain-containing protein [Ktedonobacterales bacterium]|nr:winged helix DNA-binding domain-containing protein [Ktedonobacterales bacterium]